LQLPDATSQNLCSIHILLVVRCRVLFFTLFFTGYEIVIDAMTQICLASAGTGEGVLPLR
jgi:hypothetical protein